ncbi:conidiation-specific family protein [Aspergillus flavus]|nr:conidiation-specific family protein [Aspergillus flavus]
MAHNPNPGNFANRPHDEVEDIARKGGQSSHQGGFASMDEDKQAYVPNFLMQRDIASKGGHASSGSFRPGDPRAREAGHKGGLASGGSFEPGDERAREAGHKGGKATGHPEE